SSNDDTGRRSAAAFAQRFAQRGGQVVATVNVSEAVSSNDDTGRRSAAAFAQRFAQRGGQVVATVNVS
ncbi:hypothetical protein C7E19_24865, partial [Stenotrophomonas maltophilia]